MPKETDYFNLYMKEASGEPTLIVRGVLLFFKSSFTNEELEDFEATISNQTTYSLESTEKILHSKGIEPEINRQIISLLNRKFKEAIEKKDMTTKKMEFIRSIKKKH